MVTFVSDRFLDIELILNDETGLKIPNSSIVEKEFFLIDEDFVTTDENAGTQGVIRQCYLENGNISSEFVETDAYSYDETEGVYYMDTSVLKTGDVLYKTDSQDTYTVSKRATLIGVYNVNKGYADFKQINILYQNDEYSIVKANTTYGLNVYDYIVLDGSAVSDDQIITNIRKTDSSKTDASTDNMVATEPTDASEETVPAGTEETQTESTAETSGETTENSPEPENSVEPENTPEA